jgi:CheY-like chemotaxis protein
MLKYAVVCIDDDPLITSMLSFQLRKVIDTKTTFVETYSNPSEVETHIEELIDFGVKLVFIIVDYQMPQMNGAELIRKLKRKYPWLSCIMLSGQANDLVVAELREDQLLETYISKPWNEEDLFKVVQPLIEAIRKHEEGEH